MTPDVAVEAGSGDGSNGDGGNVRRLDFGKLEVLEQMLGIKEVAGVLRMGKTWVHREARKGNLPARMIGGKYRFKPSELQQWINEQGKKAAG